MILTHTGGETIYAVRPALAMAHIQNDVLVTKIINLEVRRKRSATPPTLHAVFTDAVPLNYRTKF